jgi:hypothetical protein
MSQEVQPPWKKSAKGSVYCLWANLPEETKSQLKQQDKFESTVGEFHYSIRKNQDGSFIIFRKTREEHEARQKQSFFRKPIPRVIELLVLPIEEANTLIAAEKEYELIGNDPVKIINSQFFVIVGRKQRENRSGAQ